MHALFRFALRVSALWITFCCSWAASDDMLKLRLEETAERYHADQWPEGVTREGKSLGVIEPSGWKGGVFSTFRGHQQRTYTHSENGGKLIVDAFNADDPKGANLEMLKWLAWNQSPVLARRIDPNEMDLGDLAYVRPRPGTDAVHWVAFVRGNTAVFLRYKYARPSMDLNPLSFAQHLDRAIISSKKLNPDESRSKPKITVLSGSGSMMEGEKMPINLEIDMVDGKPSKISWNVAGSGNGYIRKEGDGKWYLYSTKAGNVKIGVEITGENGAFTVGQLNVQVLPLNKPK